MDGPTATQAIRALGCTVPIFGVTGNGLESDVKYFKSMGATDVIVKPLDIALFHRYMLEYKQA
jgi:DNA-binding response OmpR family regulator